MSLYHKKCPDILDSFAANHNCISYSQERRIVHHLCILYVEEHLHSWKKPLMVRTWESKRRWASFFSFVSREKNNKKKPSWCDVASRRLLSVCVWNWAMIVSSFQDCYFFNLRQLVSLQCISVSKNCFVITVTIYFVSTLLIHELLYSMSDNNTFKKQSFE